MITLQIGDHKILIEKQGDLYRVQILNKKGVTIAEEYLDRSSLTSAVWQLM